MIIPDQLSSKIVILTLAAPSKINTLLQTDGLEQKSLFNLKSGAEYRKNGWKDRIQFGPLKLEKNCIKHRSKQPRDSDSLMEECGHPYFR